MNITYYGHSCFGVEINGKKIVVDPFINPNELAKNSTINSIHGDYILISHRHVDHIADAETLAKRTKAKVICNYEIDLWLEKKGVTKTHKMNIGEAKSKQDLN